MMETLARYVDPQPTAMVVVDGCWCWLVVVLVHWAGTRGTSSDREK